MLDAAGMDFWDAVEKLQRAPGSAKDMHSRQRHVYADTIADCRKLYRDVLSGFSGSAVW